MTGRIDFINSPLAEVFGIFLSCKANSRRSVQSDRYDITITLLSADSEADLAIATSGLWLGTRIAPGDTATLV